MDISLELNNLNCQLQNHSSAQIIGFCIDKNCKEKNKFICSECIFDVHAQHRLVKIKELSKIIEIKYKNYKLSLEKEKELTNIYRKNEVKQKEQIEDLKKYLFEEIEKKIKNFLEELKKKYDELNNINAKDFTNLKDYEDFFIGNAAPIQKPDLTKLSEICFNIYTDNNKDTNKDVINEKTKETPKSDNDNTIEKPIMPSDTKETKNNFIFENFNKSFDKFVKEEMSSISIYINENFLNVPDNFFSNHEKLEWCENTYSGYDFFYELTNNKTKGTKFLSNGTMTILRAKDKLENNFRYRIKFKIGLKSGGDFDVGIGTEKCGDSCWLRTKESICISNVGIMNLDINMDNSIKLKNNDIIDLEISTEENKKYFKGFINDELVCLLDFDLNDIYIMAAMRNNSNFIEVLKYDASPI